MKWLAVVFLFFSVGVSATPVYRAGQATSPATRWLHGEISGGYTFTNQSLQDYLGQFSSASLRGWNVRALWSPLAWLAAGAEYTRLAEVSLSPALVDGYTLSRTGAVVKLTLSPNTNPRFYLLGGYGRSTHRLAFTSGTPAYKKAQNYWKAALGAEVAVYKSIFAAAEGEILWYETASLHTLYQLSSRMETALQVRAGIRF